jgi:hypothetical protein
MASPASKAGSGFGGERGDVESGNGGEQFVTAHVVHHGDGSQTVNKQIIAPFAGGDAVVIHETERHPPPSYYVNDHNARIIPGAATPPEPSLSGLAVASLVLGCVAAGILLMALVSPSFFFIDIGLCPLLAIVFGSVALCRIKKSRRQQPEGAVVRQWRGQWQAITGIVLGSIVLSLQIAFLVFVVIIFSEQS